MLRTLINEIPDVKMPTAVWYQILLGKEEALLAVTPRPGRTTHSCSPGGPGGAWIMEILAVPHSAVLWGGSLSEP